MHIAKTASLHSVFCALDTKELPKALALAEQMSQAGCGIKLGLEFFSAEGPAGVAAITMRYPDVPLFLDLKFHDIPNTVAGAVSAVTPLGASYINVHATGGLEMMKAAKEAARHEAGRLGITPPRILAVTMLTSLDEGAMAAVGFTGGDSTEHVVRLARLTQDAGLDGVVCSAHEIEGIRKACGDDFILMVPGIRPAGSAQGDQKRVMTPQEAMAKGASHLVIGRPITQADDPQSAARKILTEIESMAV